MSVTWNIDGADGLREATREVAEILAAGMRPILYEAAEGARAELATAYPPRDPNSRSRFEPIGSAMVVQPADQDALHPRAIVTHREILALWFEKGTTPRVTRKGWRRGQMPPAPVFVPIVVKWQRLARERLIAFVRDVAGLEVDDDGR